MIFITGEENDYEKILAALLMTMMLAFATVGSAPEAGKSVSPDDPSGFVNLAEAVPDVILEIRYYFTFPVQRLGN